MLEYGREGSLPDDGEKVRKIAGTSPREWPAIADELQEKVFSRDWRQERWDRQMKASRVRAKAGREGGQARRNAVVLPDYGEPPPAYDETAGWEQESVGQ